MWGQPGECGAIWGSVLLTGGMWGGRRRRGAGCGDSSARRGTRRLVRTGIAYAAIGLCACYAMSGTDIAYICILLRAC
eukprot:868496-Rhodomonas_salina.2